MFFSPLKSDFYRRSSSVMSVCNIDFPNLCKCIPDRLDIFRIGYYKNTVANTIFRNKSYKASCFFVFATTSLITALARYARKSVRSVHCTYLRDGYDPVPYPHGYSHVFDDLIRIIINGCTCRNAGLCSSIHCQFIYVITFPVIPNKCAVSDPIF